MDAQTMVRNRLLNLRDDLDRQQMVMQSAPLSRVLREVNECLNILNKATAYFEVIHEDVEEIGSTAKVDAALAERARRRKAKES